MVELKPADWAMLMTVLDPAGIALRRKELSVVTESGTVWADTVLEMGARDRNRLVEQLQLGFEEVANMKIAVRKYKQKVAQKRYREKPDLRQRRGEAAA